MDLKLRIIAFLWGNLGHSFTINSLNTHLKESYSYTNRIVNKLIKEKVIQKEVVGHSFNCSLNLESDKTKALIHLAEVIKKEEYLERNPNPLDGMGLPKSECIILFDNKIFLVKDSSMHSWKGKKLFDFSENKAKILQDHIVLSGFEKFIEAVYER